MVNTDQLQLIFHNRPFKTRNADEFDLEQILDLFVDPTEGLNNPFEFENSIIKGKMGSGKTMYLRANHAYYLYTLVPSLLAGAPLILPVYIRLSDFQHIHEPSSLYKEFIIKVVEEISSVYQRLLSAKDMAKIHRGIKSLPNSLFRTEPDVEAQFFELKKLTSEEYTETLQRQLKLGARAKPKFFEVSAQLQKETVVQLKTKPNPGIEDVRSAYDSLLRDTGGKILLLVDEAGAIDKSFFRESEGTTSLFEILMNQLRTADFIRTKIAVYPNSYSDVLTETRYGDVVPLQEDIRTETGYSTFRYRAQSLIERYIFRATGNKCNYSDLLEIENSNDGGEPLEQLVNASTGNLRRFVHLMDLSMKAAYKQTNGTTKITINDAVTALKGHTNDMEMQFSEPEKVFLSSLASACRSRGAFKFKFPYRAPVLYKFINKSAEYNLIAIEELGTGRRGTTYSFDYAFCVAKDLPTHYIKGTERLDKSRSRSSGTWISRVTNISDELIEQTNLPGKISGKITWTIKGRTGGCITGDDGQEYFFTQRAIVADDQNKTLIEGKSVRFYPTNSDDSFVAVSIEVL